MNNTFRFASVSRENMDVFKLGKIVNRLDKCGLFICRSGSVDLRVDNKEIHVQKGGVFIYMPSAIMRPLSMTDDAEGIMISIDVNYVIQALNKVSNIESILYLRDNPYLELNEFQYNRLIGVINQLNAKLEEIKICNPVGLKLRLAREIARSMGQCALYEIVDMFFDKKPAEMIVNSKKDIIFFNFLISLYKNYVRERDVAFYAEEQNLSPRYFSSIVKEKSGNSALQWIVHVVIGEIKRMLETSDKTIKEISVLLNFPTQSFFGKYFKQYTGMSPKDYRIKMSRMAMGFDNYME
ncbi:MAG: helix-turn-helix domain-containing protein [Bacteroidales bacterium]|nr:helix-turn-helix domain-containing protein [Bacteroidales bacterium]